ncbi:MAG: GNAT family N-acetyltransferase [Clostridia bacterium]
MKTEIEREFIRCGRRHIWMFSDEQIALRPREYYGDVSRLGHATSMIFDIMDVVTQKAVGEIALRIGESDGLFYLGHIGYHINSPFRGKHGALRACRLCIPIFKQLGMRSFVITTDVDNRASIRTCQSLGCVLESTVMVPLWCRREFAITEKKLRYIYEIPEK